jgi:hypothetical protein
MKENFTYTSSNVGQMKKVKILDRSHTVYGVDSSYNN